ncbi:MAG: hypothetical protein CSA40_01685 [Flavobacteriales bacterium]|nr:MAG: hypothetical protein CSA40_01685 [Flavobacteriales bacterium]
MSKFDEKIALYTESFNQLGISFDADLFHKVTKGLGPSIYKTDAEKVSCSQASEMETVKKNFLMKKLGFEDSPKLDDALKAACEKMGQSNRNKYRAMFYYLLVKELGAEDKY